MALHINSGYWPVQTSAKISETTISRSPRGLYPFTHMLSGLKNAPVAIQWAMNVVLAVEKWNKSPVYLKKIAIFSKTTVDHVAHIEQVSSVPIEAIIKMKPKKCIFFTKPMNFLRYIIRPDHRIFPDPPFTAFKIYEIRQKVQKLAHLWGYIVSFAASSQALFTILALLIWKVNKSQPETFGLLRDAQKPALHQDERWVVSPPFLMLRYQTETILWVLMHTLRKLDAFLLKKRPSGNNQLFCQSSSSVGDSEENPATTHKHCVALVLEILLLRSSPNKTRIIIQTDHEALQWLLTMWDSTRKVAVWRIRLCEFVFQVVHSTDSKHQTSDTLWSIHTRSASKSFWPSWSLSSNSNLNSKAQEKTLTMKDTGRETEQLKPKRASTAKFLKCSILKNTYQRVIQIFQNFWNWFKYKLWALNASAAQVQKKKRDPPTFPMRTLL